MRSHSMDDNQQHVYAVLGMARSGTSAIARGLKALGVDLGDKLTAAKPLWNAKGFFEDNDIVYKINRTALSVIDHPWMTVERLSHIDPKSSGLERLHSSAVELLKQRIQNAQYWGFKDPRTSQLLPFWQSVFKELNVQENYIIALRNPLSSAYSYQSLSGCDLEEALFMWLMHMVPAIEGTQGKNRVLVSYDLLLQDPHLQLNRIKIGLDIPDLSDSTEVDLYADQFLDKKLHHFEYTYEDLISHPAVAVVPLCLKVYDLLFKLAKDEITFDDPEFLSEWEIIKSEFNQVVPIYAYMEKLFKKNKHLERKVRNMHKSILWKCIYPLRVIDDALRDRRRKKREKKRLLRAYG